MHNSLPVTYHCLVLQHILSLCPSLHVHLPTPIHPGVPSPPVTPEQSNFTCTCSNVTWAPPLFDGATPITSYTITYTHSLTLVTINETLSGNTTSHDICGLSPNVVYNATIISTNAIGDSSPEPFEMLIEAIGKICCICILKDVVGGL